MTSPKEIADLLPIGGARVLITSRYPNWSAWASAISLDMLPLDEAIELLLRRAQRDDRTGAKSLAVALDRLPLALDHAAAVCQLTGTAFTKYAVTAGSLMDEVPDDAAYPRSVSATFTLAMNAAASRCKAAETLIAYLAMCAPERIPISLVEAALDDDRERLNAIGALTAVALIRHDPFEDGTLALTVHRLVQTVARVRCGTRSAQAMVVRIIRHLLEVYPEIDPRQGLRNFALQRLCARLTPHLLVCRELDTERASKPEWATLIVRLDKYQNYRSVRPFVGVPPRNMRFVGRENELKQVHSEFANVSSSMRLVAVHGLGGVGKTSLAIEYAHRFLDDYAGVYWCNAGFRRGLIETLAGLSTTLGTETTEERDLELAARDTLSRLGETRVPLLLVYDHVTSPEEIADLMPAGNCVRVVITSRHSEWSSWGKDLALAVWPLTEAAEFLRASAERKDDGDAEALAETLGRLPLALDQAGAYCRRVNISFGLYQQNVDSYITRAPKGAGASVADTLNRAIENVVLNCPIAEMLIEFLAQYPTERIPIALVEGAIKDKSERERAIAALKMASLLSSDSCDDGTTAVKLHRLVRAAVRVRSERERQ